MSFYRTVLVGAVTLGLAGHVLAAEVSKNTVVATVAKPAATVSAKVNINTASVDALTQVQGMTAAKAKSVVSYRTKQGSFKSLDELKQVRGFKRMDDATLKSIQDQLTVG